KGARLRPESRAVLVAGTAIHEFVALSARRALDWVHALQESASDHDRRIARLILREITERLQFLENVGVGYLSMERAASTLSGGEYGGEIVAQGTADEVARVADSLTGQFLAGTSAIEVPAKRRTPSGYIEITGASQHNLRDVDVKIPLGVFCSVTGVSGSGK